MVITKFANDTIAKKLFLTSVSHPQDKGHSRTQGPSIISLFRANEDLFGKHTRFFVFCRTDLFRSENSRMEY